MSKADTQVKWFHSTMAGAPVLSGQPGAMIALIDACLINGFSTRTPDSITVASGVATVALSAGNPYEKHAVIKITGASQPALNDEWRIRTAAANGLTFLCPGVPDGIVTGASLIRAPAGWSKPFADTNKAVYRSLHPLASGICLRIDDTHAQFPRVRGYEDMTGIDTGTNPFPTFAQVTEINYSWAKSNVATTAPRRWTLIADGLFFWFLPDWYSDTPYPAPLHRFGDFVPFNPNCTHPVVMSAYTDGVNTHSWKGGYDVSPSDSGGTYAPRSYFDNTYAPTLRRSFSAWGAWRNVDGGAQPHSPAFPAYVANGNSTSDSVGGTAPGIYFVPDRRLDWANRSFLEIGERAFLRVEVIYSSSEKGYFVLFDITEPWR
jgi:hypothetical protein